MNADKTMARSVRCGAGAWWWLLALVCVGIGTARAADRLTVATYNLQNYTLTDRRVADGFRPEYPKPEAEKAALRRVIAAMDADVIALQEIGGPGFLNELRRDLKSEGVDYPYGEALAGADETRGLGVLSRVPLGKITLHRDLRAQRRGAEHDEAVRRGLLQVDVPTPAGVVTLFVVHLKSRITETKEDPEAEEQRVAEAQAIRDRVLALFPEPGAARFVMAGDFNDLPGSRTLKAFQARGKTTISTWVDAADERGQRWTHAYGRTATYSRFDHVFVSGGFAASTVADAVGTGGVTGAATARIVGEPWEAVAAASDHRPVVLTLSLSK